MEKWHKNKDVLAIVWRLALPVVLTNFLQSVVAVVDIYMIGRLGPLAIAASGMGNVIRMLVLVMMLSVSGGAMSLVSQAKGARDPQRMSFVTRQAISSGVILSIFMVIFGVTMARPLLSFANSGGDAEAVLLGTSYLQILFLGTPFLVLNMLLNRVMQGAGDTVTPLILTLFINALNILFNYMLIFGFGPIPAIGLNGAAIGTVMARFLGAAVALAIIYSGKNVIKLLPGTSYWPDRQMFIDILSIGVPSGIQGVFRNGARLLVIGILTSTEVGTYGAAAIAIGFQIESLAFMPVLGLNVAGTSLVGRELGRWQVAEARKRGNMTVGLGILVMIVLISPIVIFAPQILRLFDPSAHPIVQSAGVAYLRINAIGMPLTALAMVSNGNLRGGGDTLPGMYSTFINKGAITVVTSYVLAIVLGLGSVGVWIGLLMGQVLDGVVLGLRWRGDAWLQVALQKTDVYRQHLHSLSDTVQQQYLSEVRAPLMGEPKTQEKVSAEGVVYQLVDREVNIVFKQDSYITA